MNHANYILTFTIIHLGHAQLLPQSPQNEKQSYEQVIEQFILLEDLHGTIKKAN